MGQVTDQFYGLGLGAHFFKGCQVILLYRQEVFAGIIIGCGDLPETRIQEAGLGILVMNVFRPLVKQVLIGLPGHVVILIVGCKLGDLHHQFPLLPQAPVEGAGLHQGNTKVFLL